MKHLSLLLPGLLVLLSCMQPDAKTSMASAKTEDATTLPVFTNITAAVFSEISYCTAPQAQLDKHLPGWKVVWNPAAIGGNYAFVATDGEKYAIAFRGSLLSFTEDAFNNWIYHDLNVAVQDKWPYCKNDKAKISHGAYMAWQNIEKLKDRSSGKSLWEFLSVSVKPEKPLYLTGHSLGGNLAITYASYLWFKYNESGKPKNNISITTFAAPAAGNNAFAEDFDKKFPGSVRIDNTNDIVTKFPCTKRMKKLGDLYTDGPSASKITIGYNNITATLNSIFTVISTGLDMLEFSSGFSGYEQTCGDGKQITIGISGKNKGNTASDWFAEAGYQHSMERYAAAIGAPVIKCD